MHEYVVKVYEDGIGDFTSQANYCADTIEQAIKTAKALITSYAHGGIAVNRINEDETVIVGGGMCGDIKVAVEYGCNCEE